MKFGVELAFIEKLAFLAIQIVLWGYQTVVQIRKRGRLVVFIQEETALGGHNADIIVIQMSRKELSSPSNARVQPWL